MCGEGASWRHTSRCWRPARLYTHHGRCQSTAGSGCRTDLLFRLRVRRLCREHHVQLPDTCRKRSVFDFGHRIHVADRLIVQLSGYGRHVERSCPRGDDL